MPQGGHGDDPAVAFSVDYSLSDVCDEGDGEEDGEDVGGGDVRAEFPDGVVVIVGDVAMRMGGIVDCHLGDVFVVLGARRERTRKVDNKGKENLWGKVAKKHRDFAQSILPEYWTIRAKREQGERSL